MAKITLEIPDHLAEQLARRGENPSDWLQQRLPALLEENSQPPILPAHVYRYILDFIASNPTPQQIADFRPTPKMQKRLRFLLSRNKFGELTPDEEAELNEYKRIEHIVIMLKVGNVRMLRQ
ncbi:hypothetical protein H6F88_32195 [Oculatella sp. FACHB-28]|uniref:hypothetical protein n=1 Tax=Oculatella sp. FACHB-28 TaxID=2692845 RepID=UPI001685B15A|nr:hypothetical protein [Oculatella sp. FACHB-28]MBD2060606.1 hypothetical protein [Oculatella sp. FACHB-28]